MRREDLGIMAGAGVGVALLYYIWRRGREARSGEDWERVGEISQLFFYPVKSMRGLSLERAEVTLLGLNSEGWLDRSLIVVDANDTFVTARTQPRLVLIRPELREGRRLHLSADGAEPFSLVLPEEESEEHPLRHTQLWGAQPISGLDLGRRASEWLSRALGGAPYSFRLLHFRPGLPNSRVPGGYHKATKRMAERSDATLYSDATTYHLLSQSSLDILNAELPEEAKSIGVSTFRPNFTLGACKAWDELNWTQIRIGDENSGPILTVVKHTDRCFLTTTDMERGEHRKDGEPVKTLRRIQPGSAAQKKLNRHAPIFGLNLFADRGGAVAVGDVVYARRATKDLRQPEDGTETSIPPM